MGGPGSGRKKAGSGSKHISKNNPDEHMRLYKLHMARAAKAKDQFSYRKSMKTANKHLSLADQLKQAGH